MEVTPPRFMGAAMKTKRVVGRFVPVLMVVACVGGTGCVGSSKVRATASTLGSSRVAGQNNACCASAHNNLGISCAIAGQLDEARSALCRAISLQPRKALYRNNLAAVLIDQGRYDSAFRQLLAAHGSAIGHYNLQYMLSRKLADDGGETSLVTRLMGGRSTAGDSIGINVAGRGRPRAGATGADRAALQGA